MVPFLKTPSMVQYSSGLKSFISFSRSMINLRATDCTRPAESPFLTFFQRIGEIEYPTIRSKTRRACWASTKSISIWRGSLKAFLTASLVISLKTTRFFSLASKFKICAKCQEIASPSRSGSLARKTCLAFLASFFKSLIKGPFPRILIYSGS